MSARYDWNKFGRQRVALLNRIMRWVVPCIAAVLWVEFILLAMQDWTVIFAPLLMTAFVVAQQVGLRKVYATERPRPDYAAIARMEREVYGETFKHEGAPPARRTVSGPHGHRAPATGTVTMAEFGRNMTRFGEVYGRQMCAEHDRPRRWDGRTTHPDTTQSASIEDYVLWLQGYVKRGGRPTHFYDYPFSRAGFRYASTPLTVDSDYEYGSSSREIIVARNVATDRTNPTGPFGGWAHTQVYFMHGYRSNKTIVPVYSDPEFDAIRERFADPQTARSPGCDCGEHRSNLRWEDRSEPRPSRRPRLSSDRE